LGDGGAGYDRGYGVEGFAECVEYYLVGVGAAYYL